MEVAAFQVNPFLGKVTGPVASVKLMTRVRPHLVVPSAFPHTLLTVSGNTAILSGGSVDLKRMVYLVGGVIFAGLSDVDWQSQSERILTPAIDRVMLVPGLLTII
jgi:hypothetical protein